MIVPNTSGKQIYKGFNAKLTEYTQEVDKTNTLQHNSSAGNTKQGLSATSLNAKKLHNVAKKKPAKHAKHRKHALATLGRKFAQQNHSELPCSLKHQS